MAFDDKTRGRLQKLVTTCRGLLTDEFSIQVQQTYGLDPNTGDVTPLERLTLVDAFVRPAPPAGATVPVDCVTADITDPAAVRALITNGLLPLLASGPSPPPPSTS